ncbi:hypothetical protein VKT23_008256 [Stygiomarasmius scandens]|uniref:Extracellular membrane protein CFEM domain-containing protein n=1 Tax=Marasmiellus scandens TaxID=2682957 RepID=A0ABR1JN32_9AGAR
MRTISAPALALVFASLASAATLSIRQNPSARTLKHLLVRQSDSSTLDPSELPPQCQSLCTSAVSILNECTSGVACGCSSSDLSDLETCFNCLGNAAPGLQDSLDSSLNGNILVEIPKSNAQLFCFSTDYETACQAGGSTGSSSGTGSGSFSDSNDTPTGSGSSPAPTSSSSRGGSSSTGTGSSSSSDDSDSDSDSTSSSSGTGSKSGSGTSGSNSGSSGGGLGTGGAMSNSVNMFGLTLVAVFGGMLVL